MPRTVPPLIPKPILVFSLAILLGACASRPPTPVTPIHIHDTVTLPPTVAPQANAVAFHAFNLVGAPYQWGGESPRTGFDCSGLVQYVYREAVGMDLPRTSSAMSRLPAPKISNVHKLATGDLLFFRTTGSGISHVAIYIGDGRFVDAPSRGEKVRVRRLTQPYWRNHFAFARRVLEEK